MRNMCMLFFVAVFPCLELSCAWQVLKIGNYPIVGTSGRTGFILNDGCIYKPLDRRQRKKTRVWQLGDQILLLSGKGKHRYILVNTRTGQTSKMRGVHW